MCPHHRCSPIPSVLFQFVVTLPGRSGADYQHFYQVRANIHANISLSRHRSQRFRGQPSPSVRRKYKKPARWLPVTHRYSHAGIRRSQACEPSHSCSPNGGFQTREPGRRPIPIHLRCRMAVPACLKGRIFAGRDAAPAFRAATRARRPVGAGRRERRCCPAGNRRGRAFLPYPSGHPGALRSARRAGRRGL